MSETPKQHLEATDVAPHGWERFGKTGDGLDLPDPCFILDGYWYVPAKPQPRTWTGTVRALLEDNIPVDRWGDEVQVTVTEVLPEGQG